MNTSASAIQNTPEERHYNIRSWLTLRKEDTVMKKKRDQGHIGFGKGGRNAVSRFYKHRRLKI
jgi:hypothetical protein